MGHFWEIYRHYCFSRSFIVRIQINFNEINFSFFRNISAMSMIFNAQAFDRLRPLSRTGIPLTKREKLRPPAGKIDNPVAQLVRFASAMGLSELSAKTVRALRDHPYYRYVFYGVFRHNDPISDNSYFAEKVRPRLLELLRDPDSLTDQDIYEGIEHYTNNFFWYLPGGFYRTPEGVKQKSYGEVHPVLEAVDRALRKLGLDETEVLIRRLKMEQERHLFEDYTHRAAFMKLAVRVFELVVKEGFDPAVLWI
jgi:hypothetical protein